MTIYMIASYVIGFGVVWWMFWADSKTDGTNYFEENPLAFLVLWAISPVLLPALLVAVPLGSLILLVMWLIAKSGKWALGDRRK